MIKVFVYGTLKSGYSNHIIMEYQKKAMKAIAPKMLLLDSNAFPFAFEGSEDDFIIGEMYEVDADSLDRMDQLEGYPDFYNRKLIDVQDLQETLSAKVKPETHKAWVYYIEDKSMLNRLASQSGCAHEWKRPERQMQAYTLSRSQYAQQRIAMHNRLKRKLNSKGEPLSA